MTEPEEMKDEDLTRLYRKVAVEQPSAGLDARILTAARAAARPARPAAATSWVSSWRIPVALAATVLLSFTLTLLVREGEEGRVLEPDQATGTKPVTGGARAPLPANDIAPKADAPVPAVPSSAPRTAPQRQAQPRAAAPAAQGAPGQSGAGTAESGELRAAPKTEGFVPDAAGAAGNLARERKEMPVAPDPASRDEARSGVMKGEAVRGMTRPEALPAPSAPLATPKALPQGDAPALRMAVPPASASSAPQAMPQASPPAAPALRIAPAPAPAPAAKRADPAAEKAERKPEQWLADIRKLRLGGRTAEAEASLVEFKQRYPMYPLPEDLK